MKGNGICVYTFQKNSKCVVIVDRFVFYFSRLLEIAFDRSSLIVIAFVTNREFVFFVCLFCYFVESGASRLFCAQKQNINGKNYQIKMINFWYKSFSNSNTEEYPKREIFFVHLISLRIILHSVRASIFGRIPFLFYFFLLCYYFRLMPLLSRIWIFDFINIDSPEIAFISPELNWKRKANIHSCLYIWFQSFLKNSYQLYVFTQMYKVNIFLLHKQFWLRFTIFAPSNEKREREWGRKREKSTLNKVSLIEMLQNTLE